MSYAHSRTPGRTSIVNGSSPRPIEGKLRRRPLLRADRRTSELFINPLMAIYFAFELAALAKQSLYLPLLEDTEINLRRLRTSRRSGTRVEPRPRVPIPH